MTSSPTERPWLSALRRHWPVAAGFLSALALCLGPVNDPDVYWHVAAARWMLAHRAIPSADSFSWTEAGRPWIDFEWATQLLYYALDRAGGAGALWLFKLAACAALLYLFLRLLRLWDIEDAWIGVALPFATLSMLPLLDIRPELATFLFTLGQLYVLEARRLGRSAFPYRSLLAAQALAYAVWVNLHAGFPLGLALCLLYGLGELPRRDRALSYFGLGAAGLLGTFVNPWGPGLWRMFAEHGAGLEALHAMAIQWRAPSLLDPARGAYWALLAFSLATAGWAVLKPREAEWGPTFSCLAFALFSLTAVRQTPYAALVAFPLALRDAYRRSSAETWLRLRPYALTTVFTLVGFAEYPVLDRSGLLRRIDQASLRAPAAACDFLRRESGALSALPLYNDWNFGGYLEYALYPGYKVFVDGRYIFNAYLPLIAKAASSPPQWAAFLRTQGVSLAVLQVSGISLSDPNMGIRRPADVYFMPRSEWALVFWDTKSTVWVRRGAVPEAWLKTREYRYLYPGDFEFISLGVKGGGYPLSEVEAEIERACSEGEDPDECAGLRAWERGLSRSLPSPF